MTCAMNTWLWESVEEFEKLVCPIEGAYRHIIQSQQFNPASRNVESFFDYLHGFAEQHYKLRLASCHVTERQFSDQKFQDVITASYQLVHNAECVLACCRPLAVTKAASNFISIKDWSEHLQRYGPGKSVSRVQQLVERAERLLEEIHDFLGGDGSFLKNVSDLPDDLKSDFVGAWNMMSLGFDEAGLIYSGRGLEGVMRRIANNHGVGPTPTERAKFWQLLDALEKKRFAHDQTLVIDEGTKHQLNFSRAVRNQSVHPTSQGMSQGYQEQAVLMAQKANELWKKCSAPGVQFV